MMTGPACSGWRHDHHFQTPAPVPSCWGGYGVPTPAEQVQYLGSQFPFYGASSPSSYYPSYWYGR
jgi:hypothetical protein